MAKGKKAHPHQSKPYEQKVAERNAAKRAMRTGGELNAPSKSRPDTPQGTPNPQEASKLSGGPNTQRNPSREGTRSQQSSSEKPREVVTEQAKARMNNGPADDEI